jgi:hypothetical protein
MKLKFKVTFKKGMEIVTSVEGIRIVDTDDMTVTEVSEKVIQTEAFLEKLTGLRVHIEQVN